MATNYNINEHSVIPSLHIGLTGGIATGKSAIANWFVEYGFAYFNADKVVHQLLSDQALLTVGEIVPHALNDNGLLNRAILAEAMFTNDDIRRSIEAILHPLVLAEMHQFIKQHRFTISEIPLLFELQQEKFFDLIVSTILPGWLQEKRAMMRHGMTLEKYHKIISLQCSNQYRIDHSDYIVDTELPIHKTKQQVLHIIQTHTLNAK